jgi:hypothetical protein
MFHSSPLLSSKVQVLVRHRSGRTGAARHPSNSIMEFSEFSAAGGLHIRATVSVPFTDM